MKTTSLIRRAFIVIASLVATAPHSVRAQPPNYGLDFVEIGDPGNRPANRAEAPHLHPPYLRPPWLIGRVPYRYRITRTEVTVSQWFEFVQAYAPYWEGPRHASELTGFYIVPSGNSYRMVNGAENFPTNMGWRVAARYCNWLHNGKVNAPWAFETGVYDTSTFTTNPNGTINDQVTHSPGAKFWIATNDEWTKAMYYDPNRYGLGQSGYWLYPHGSNTSAVPGLPGTPGAQTGAGTIPNDPGGQFPVGSYPDVLSPWGLLDGSGGVSEWTEYIQVLEPRDRVERGSWRQHSRHESADRLDRINTSAPWSSFPGLRIASQVPSPATVLLPAGLLLLTRRRS